jgi:hypothetical protein
MSRILLRRSITPAGQESTLESGQGANAPARTKPRASRRRIIDPATCGRDYDRAELEFGEAIQDYKQKSGRMFPTWSEVLEVLKSLGYEKPVRAMLLLCQMARSPMDGGFCPLASISDSARWTHGGGQVALSDDCPT